MRVLCTALLLTTILSPPAMAEEPFVFRPPPTPPSSTSKEPGEGFSRLRVNVEANLGYGGYLGTVFDNDAVHGRTFGGALGVTWERGKPNLGARISMSYSEVAGREYSDTELLLGTRPAEEIVDGVLLSVRAGVLCSWDNGLWVAGQAGMLFYHRTYEHFGEQRTFHLEVVFEGGYNLYFGDVLALQVSGELGTNVFGHARVQLRTAVLLRL